MKRFLLFTVLLMLLTAGCTGGKANHDPWQYQMQTGLGGLNESMDYQEFSYTFTLGQTGKTDLEDVGITLQLNESYKTRLVEQSGLLEEHLPVMGQSSTVTLEGKLLLETKGLTKQQIIEMGPVIDSGAITWKENGESKTKTLTL